MSNQFVSHIGIYIYQHSTLEKYILGTVKSSDSLRRVDLKSTASQQALFHTGNVQSCCLNLPYLLNCFYPQIFHAQCASTCVIAIIVLYIFRNGKIRDLGEFVASVFVFKTN